jgi:hypothetical protein
MIIHPGLSRDLRSGVTQGCFVIPRMAVPGCNHACRNALHAWRLGLSWWAEFGPEDSTRQPDTVGPFDIADYWESSTDLDGTSYAGDSI